MGILLAEPPTHERRALCTPERRALSAPGALVTPIPPTGPAIPTADETRIVPGYGWRWLIGRSLEIVQRRAAQLAREGASVSSRTAHVVVVWFGREEHYYNKLLDEGIWRA